MLSPKLLQKLILAFVFLWAYGAFGQTHTASWTINTSQCTTTQACTAQIWRVVIPSGTCPAVGNSAYVNIQTAVPNPTITATQTTWLYTDSGPALTSGSIYCGYSTYTPSGGAASSPSAIFQGNIQAPPVVLPAPGIAVTLK